MRILMVILGFICLEVYAQPEGTLPPDTVWHEESRNCGFHRPQVLIDTSFIASPDLPDDYRICKFVLRGTCNESRRLRRADSLRVNDAVYPCPLSQDTLLIMLPKKRFYRQYHQRMMKKNWWMSHLYLIEPSLSGIKEKVYRGSGAW